MRDQRSCGNHRSPSRRSVDERMRHFRRRVPGLLALVIDPGRVAVIVCRPVLHATRHTWFLGPHPGAATLLVVLRLREGDLNTALSVCMRVEPSAPDVAELAAVVRQRADDGKIAPLAGMKGDRIFVFHGVPIPPWCQIGASTEAPSIAGQSGNDLDVQVDFTHAFPARTFHGGGKAHGADRTFVAACGVDTAGLVPGIWATRLSPPPTRRALSVSSSVNCCPMGWILCLPMRGMCFSSQCDKAAVDYWSLHGCDQNVDKVGEAFAAGARTAGRGLPMWSCCIHRPAQALRH